jgi:antitoxin component of RelBE/YafQ-DinJ toxin-antitoxin module
MEDNNQAPSSAPTSDVSQEAPQVDQSQESGQESQQQTQEAKQAVAEKKRLNKLMLKIDGEEYEEDLPFEVDEDHAEYLKKNLQLSKKAQKSMQSEASLRSQVDQFVKSLKGDTKNTLKQMGIDPKEFAAMIIEEELQQQAMTPEQRERAELEAKLKALEDERRLEKEEFDKREYERLTQQEYERIDTKMTAVIDQAGIPKSPYVVKKIAQYMQDGLQYGVNLEPEDVIGLVKEEIQSDLKELLSALGEDKVESFIGKDILDKVRKKNLAKAKSTPATLKAAIKDVGSSKKVDTKPQERKNMKDFFGI